MNIYDPIKFTQRYVYGRDVDSNTLSTSDDYNDHIRPDGSVPPGFQFDMLDYLTNGAGRYAIPSVFPIVDTFFNSEIDPDNYNASQLRTELQLTTQEFQDDSSVGIWQYGTDTTSLDFAERAYIFGTTGFTLDLSNATFVVNADGSKNITGMRVKTTPGENFDFEGGAGPINTLANEILLPAYDPYGLGREAVSIEFITSTQGKEYGTVANPYDRLDYIDDSIYEFQQISIVGTNLGLAKLVTGISNFFLQLPTLIPNLTSTSLAGSYLLNINSDPFTRYLKDDFKVIYGTPDNDDIDPNDRENDVFDPFPIFPQFLMVGGAGNDAITSFKRSDRLLGGDGNDILQGGIGDDTLNGGANNDILSGGQGDDVAIFTDDFSNYNYSISQDGKTITLDHKKGGIDGVDTLKEIEWGFFKSTSEPLASNSTENEIARRIIPLPLEDGIEHTEYIGAIDTTVNPNPRDLPTPPNATLSAPVAMLDGDIEYTLNISPYEPDTEYNIAYIFDTSASMDAEELQIAKDAYTDLTNYFVDNELAENINFGVVQFSRNATPYFNLTAEEAISTIQGLTTASVLEGTKYNDGLYQGFNFLTQSTKNALNTTNIAYFVADGKSQTNFFDPNDISYHDDAQRLRRFAHVQAFGIDDGTNAAGAVTTGQLNFIDSNQGEIVGDASNLSSALLQSGLAGSVEGVNILLDGEIVDTLTPEMLTDTPLGLTYEGELDQLDVSIDAENVITAEVVFTPEANLETTTVEHIVTAGEGEVIGGDGNPIDESGSGNEDQDPFEKIRNGGDSNDRITLGYVDRGANGGEGGDYIIGNNRDNILDGGAGNDTILGHGGDDTITPGEGRDKVDGGEGIDTVLYSDVIYQDNANIFLRRAGNTVSYNNTDSLTNIEYLQFADVRLNAETFEVAPIVEVEDITIVEGNSATSLAQFTFNLNAPTTAEITFNYSTEDISATADSDYNAIAGQVIIPGGETTATVEVEVIGDRTEEDHESFALQISDLSGATFNNNKTEYTSFGTIEDDDTPRPLTIEGDAEDNTLVGGILSDSLSGNGGNDRLTGDAGDDVLDGGDGIDTVVETADANFTLTDTSLVGNGTDILSNIEAAELTGGVGNNRLNAAAATMINVTLDGAFGNNTLHGGAKDDVLITHDGNDRLFGRNGNDTLTSGAGDDYLSGANNNDVLTGGMGDDTIDGGNGIDTLVETADANLTLTDTSLVGNGIDVLNRIETAELTGGDGNNHLNAVGANIINVTLDGAGGNDTLSGSPGDDMINGGDGVDTVVESGNKNFTLTDTSLVGNGTDVLTKIEIVELTGGAGNNRLNANDTTAIAVTLDGAFGNNTLYGGAKDDLLIAHDGNDRLFGRNGNDTLTSGEGDDYLSGANHDDALTGGLGDDTINGGNGIDTLVESGNNNFTLTDTSLVGNGTDVLTKIEAAKLTGGAGNNRLIAADATMIQVTLDGAEGNNTLHGGAQDDLLITHDGNDRLFGRNGNDTLTSGAGDDYLSGANHDDVLTGGLGDDTINGGNGIDTLVESGNNNFTLTDSSLVGNGTDVLTKIERAKLTGGFGNNRLNANDTTAIAVTLDGAGGNDTLHGGAQDDLLITHDGNDRLFGRNGNDTLNGGAGDDYLSGANHDDVLTSGAGDDTLYGGNGSDVFILQSIVGTDMIQDFSDGVDSFGLSGSLGFSDLSMTNNAEGTATLIRDTTNNQLLAIIDNVNATDITVDDFISI